jgi:phenylpropionate dioxygenase-like ring-hydroxylating dioxygenase large terminal subunit
MDTPAARTSNSIDTGTGYGRPRPEYLRDLTEVGAGTPMGELLRRYWHPIGLKDEACEIPRKVRVLGEDLILFRDKSGRPGLLHARCAHRGATLYYGKVDEEGIRCCYHGWKFDVEGHCLDQPCEPQGGRARHAIRQPWYALQERYGLIFAYMGPPEKKPVLPRFATLEELADDETVLAEDQIVRGAGPAIYDCNWLQNFENIVDTFHVPILHAGFSTNQFNQPAFAQMPVVRWEYTKTGVSCITDRVRDDGTILRRTMEAYLPTLQIVMAPHEPLGRVRRVFWTLPIDDTHNIQYAASRMKKTDEPPTYRFDGTHTWSEMTADERRRYPGDYEAQTGQGPITLHSEEHLAKSDAGIAMLRNLLRRQWKAVERGEDPIGVSFDPAEAPIEFVSGQWIVPAQN